MRKIFHSHARPLSFLLVAACSALILGCKTGPLGDPEELARENREKYGVSILSVNLLDIMNYPHSSTGVTWQTRYTRIFTWMKDTGNFPDVIALQEAPGYWDCSPTDSRRLPDYGAIDFLLDGIRDATGEQYRIAYLVALQEGGTNGNSWIGTKTGQFCRARGGRALLYRPSRIKNVINRPSGGTTALGHDATPPIGTTYLASSIPCCFPAADRMDVCPLVDGPLQTSNRCSTPTPLGVAWTRVVEVPKKDEWGNPKTKLSQGAVFSRLELVNQPGNYIHVYNVHRVWNDFNPQNLQIIDFDSQNINQLVTDMESRFQSSSNPTLYPPILVGDFNVGSRPDTRFLDSFFPAFEVGAWSDGGEPDGALFGRGPGNVPSFPATKHKAFANLQHVMPKIADEHCNNSSPDMLWSDHCAIFFRVEPSRR